jgi:hypothetical protein
MYALRNTITKDMMGASAPKKGNFAQRDCFFNILRIDKDQPQKHKASRLPDRGNFWFVSILLLISILLKISTMA